MSTAGANPSYDPRYRMLMIELDKLAPSIRLSPGSVSVIREPAIFYATMKEKIARAKKKIFLSTLYIGRTEHELIACLQARLRACPTLKVSILTDALRGTREAPDSSCASLIAPLISEFGTERVEISMFHTPNLHGMKKKVIPRRFDEGWGLQHMKLYGFDDEIMLSGANLSNDYFTDRQDRYHLISSVEATRFYERLHNAISSISYKLSPSDNTAGFSLSWSSPGCPEPVKDRKGFIRHAQDLVREVIRPKPMNHCDFTFEKPLSTILYPLAQMNAIMDKDNLCSTEQPALNRVLDSLSSNDHADTRWHFTAGYFNIFQDYRERLIRALGQGTIITASPDANGFYGSSGPSGMLAAAYTLLSKRFLDDVQSAGKDASIDIKEWKRGEYGQKDRWTYHAKGLWIHPTSADSAGPSLTFIGSSNFTRRSQNLDLEATGIIITADPKLQADLAGELANLNSFATRITSKELQEPARKANYRTRFALWLCQGML